MNKRARIWTALAAAATAALLASEAPGGRYYSLDSWMGAIGLPDDPFKSTVNADGAFLTERGKASERFALYPLAPNQTPLTIRADLAGGTERVSQRMSGPRVPISITIKRQGAVVIEETLFLARPLDWSAGDTGSKLDGRDSLPRPRQYLMMIEYRNTGDKPEEIAPVLEVEGASPGPSLDDASRFDIALNTRCRTTLPVDSFRGRKLFKSSITMKMLSLPPGGNSRWVLAINRDGFDNAAPVDWPEAEKLREGASAYWEKEAGLPFGVIRVPDPWIQSVLDTSIRELYQMRYVIGGLPAFFFGPWCYNDYWILDGSFVTEAMAMLGRAEDASGYADYLLRHQHDDGRIQCISSHWKETGIALVTLLRHARMIRDKAWLAERWPQFRRAAEAVVKLRRFGSSADPSAPNYGLSPEGFGDGGVGFTAEYTNNHWLLAGMKAAAEAAAWLGKTEDARAWDEQYRDFDRAFQKAIARDAKADEHGNRYIPAVMGPATPEFPTRGQWAFCQGVYPGRIFRPDDPLMLGTLKMMEAREVQGGIVENSGWIGIWPQCGSFYGHDWLWLGRGDKAARLLHAFADHASPVWNFREESPKQTRPGQVFPFTWDDGGDMPHVSAAAEFVRLAGHLLAFDRGQELHLLEGLPREWLKPGMTTAAGGLGTPFGPLNMELTVAANGKTATLKIDPVDDPDCRKIVVHVGGWAAKQNAAVRELDPKTGHVLKLKVMLPAASR